MRTPQKFFMAVLFTLIGANRVFAQGVQGFEDPGVDVKIKKIVSAAKDGQKAAADQRRVEKIAAQPSKCEGRGLYAANPKYVLNSDALLYTTRFVNCPPTNVPPEKRKGQCEEILDQKTVFKKGTLVAAPAPAPGYQEYGGIKYQAVGVCVDKEDELHYEALFLVEPRYLSPK